MSLAWQSILDLYVSRRIYLSRSPLMTCSGLSSIAYPRNIASIRMPCSTATTKTRNSVRSAKGFPDADVNISWVAPVRGETLTTSPDELTRASTSTAQPLAYAAPAAPAAYVKTALASTATRSLWNAWLVKNRMSELVMTESLVKISRQFANDPIPFDTSALNLREYEKFLIWLEI